MGSISHPAKTAQGGAASVGEEAKNIAWASPPDLLPRRKPIFGILLFKVAPLPHSREIAAEKKEREHDESGYDTLSERMRRVQQCESEQHGQSIHQTAHYSSSQKSDLARCFRFQPLL